MSEKKISSPFARQCFVTAAVCGNIIGHGSALGYPAVLLPQLADSAALGTLDKDTASWIASAMAMPMLVGNFLSPPIMDRLGRRAAHYAVTVPVILGWIIIIMATSFEAVVIGRVLHGLSFGLSLPLRAVLIGEYTSPARRGAFLTMVSLTQSVGIFFAHLVGSFLSWQRTALVCIFFSFLSLVMMMYAPESPSYLAARGDFDKCREVFRWLRGNGEDKELEEMILARQVAANDEVKKVTLRKLKVVIKKKEFNKPILLMVHAYAMAQFAGGTTMASYSTVIIGSILGPKASVKLWMISLDVQRIISNAIAVYFINKYRRRVMMFSMGSLSVLAHLGIVGYLQAKTAGLISDSLVLPAILINLHFFTVATGMVPIPNVIAGEVFPLEYRSIGGSISVISTACFMFLVLKTFPGLLEAIGLSGTYLIYAGAIVYFLGVMWFLLPETKGRTLQQIEDEYKGKGKVAVLRDVEREPLSLSLDEKIKLKKMEIEARKLSVISIVL